MEGVRVLEVAQFTYTPAAGAVLADWGADVIKVEHPVAGDAQRGLRIGISSHAEGSFSPIMEHLNRGKRSIGLALDEPAGLEILYELARSSDVFLTNFQVRANGYIATVLDAEGNERELVTNPVQFNETPAALRRAPQFAEHTDEILRELHRDDDQIIQLKIDGVIT
jgi:crotonobetainyl-CoA:carnitine CoA-transferase CaiB-like acyl-CoA transferase